MKPDSILFIAEGPRRHTPGLQRAFDLAHRTGAPVHLVLVAHDPVVERAANLVSAEVFQLARRQFTADRQAWLDALIAAWRRDGLKASGEVLWTVDAHETIVKLCLERAPTLVIKDSAHQGRLQKLLLGSLDWKLVRYCPAPLMLVRPGSESLPKTVLAAVDISTGASHPLNDRIAETALALGGHTGADVHLAHAFPHARTAYAAVDRLYDAVRDNDARAFQAFADRHDFPARVRHWAAGTPAKELARIIKAQGVDLVVMGSAYRSPFDRMFLGSTAAAAVAELPCDLLLIKPEGFAVDAAAARHGLAA